MLRSATVLLSAVAFVASPAAKAQGHVYYPDDNVAPNYSAPAGWFPWFTNATGTRIQMLVPASAFASTAAPGLSSIGFFLGGSTPANTNATFTILQIRIGPAGSPTLTNTFATNLVPGTETLVVDAPGTTIAPSGGAWVDFPFTSMLATPTGSIVVDIQTQIPSGGAYLQSTVSSSVPRCVQGTYTGQTTGTLGTSSGCKMRFGLVLENILNVATSGGGVGDLAVSLTMISPAAASGFTLISADTAATLGSGPVLGIYPDLTTWSILIEIPVAPGNPLHFLTGYPGLFPDAPLNVAPGTLSFLSGQTWDFVALLTDASGFGYVGRSNVVRVVW
jgi:hypothetical protein